MFRIKTFFFCDNIKPVVNRRISVSLTILPVILEEESGRIRGKPLKIVSHPLFILLLARVI